MTDSRPRIEGIAGVTHVVADLASAETAYTTWLDYRLIDRGQVGAGYARRWGVPVMHGCPTVTLVPASGEEFFLRFVEHPSARRYRALTSFGWTATEFVVQDVDALAARLAYSPFKIIGQPMGLNRFPMIRAMQVIGPGGECLYLTEIGVGSGLTLAPAQSFVGRAFIVVAGGPDVTAMFAIYSNFANAVDPPVATPVRIISEANGLPIETLHTHGLVRLGGGTMIELDGYPSAAVPRVVAPGALPPGMAVVHFTVSGHPSAVYRGAGGEIIEFIRQGDADAAVN
jgi:hypothetical protein